MRKATSKGILDLFKKAHKKIEELQKDTFLNRMKKRFHNNDHELSNLLEANAIRELKLTEAQLELEDLQDQLVDVVYKINAVNEIELSAQLELNKMEMKLWLKEHKPKDANKLEQLLVDQRHAQKLLVEIEEAITVGQAAKSALIDAAAELNKAKDYSTWDTFLGGGIFVTYLKHEKMNLSNSYLHKAQRALQKFQNEMLDLKGYTYRSLEVNVDGFVTFADFFFDDFFLHGLSIPN